MAVAVINFFLFPPSRAIWVCLKAFGLGVPQRRPLKQYLPSCEWFWSGQWQCGTHTKKARTVDWEMAGCSTHRARLSCPSLFLPWTKAAAVGVGDRTVVGLGDFLCQPAPGSFLSEGRDAVGADKASKGRGNTEGYPHMVNPQAATAQRVCMCGAALQSRSACESCGFVK